MTSIRLGQNPPALSNATDAYLGYAYQGLQALLLLLDAGDGEAVGVETDDDIVLQGQTATLNQLKHSLANRRPLTLKNDGWWRAIEIWLGSFSVSPGRYCFITTAPTGQGSELDCLSESVADRQRLMLAMTAEASRIVAAVDAPGSPDASPRYRKRYAGCRMFLALDDATRLSFLQRVTLHPRALGIDAIPDAIAARLAPIVVQEQRLLIVERLIEWWDRRVVLGLLGKQSRWISKAELTVRIQDLVGQLGSLALPDDFSMRMPPEDVTATNSMIQQQIELVAGGESRILRALVAYWQATEQRTRWLKDDIAASGELADYDERLTKAWGDRHGPMRDDCMSVTEDTKQQRGRDLLDWSHLRAYLEVSPIRPNSQHAFYTQGTFQRLAEMLRVGWHPLFKQRLRLSRRTGRSR